MRYIYYVDVSGLNLTQRDQVMQYHMDIFEAFNTNHDPVIFVPTNYTRIDVINEDQPKDFLRD